MVVVEAAAPETDWITQKTEDGAQNNITQLAGVEPSGVGTSAATVQLVPEEMANNSPLLTLEELRLQRWGIDRTWSDMINSQSGSIIRLLYYTIL